MREIKFRGKNMNGEWHYGLLSHVEKQYAKFGGMPTEGWYISNVVGRPFAYQVRPETIGQYTGIRDTNCVEIYENDVVTFTRWWFDGRPEEEISLTGTVVYLPGCMSFGLDGIDSADWIKHIGGDEGSTDVQPFSMFLFDEADFEVIGNVFDGGRR